jgi:hypothetical protein
MARTFRQIDLWDSEGKPGKRAGKAQAFAMRSAARELADLGYDTPAALAARPIHGARARREANRLLNA